MRFFERRRARRALASRVALFYDPSYAAPQLAPERRIPTVQLDRAERALARLAAQGLVCRDDVRRAPAIELADLLRVHTGSYIERVANPSVLAAIFGVPSEDIDVDALLGAQRQACGGTLAAARSVTQGRQQVAVNLGGGFHHAAPDGGSGFCIFNDVAVAIATLRAEGFAEPIAIVDLDFHQGDGNLACFAADPQVLVYSVHGAAWTDASSAASRNYALPSGTGDAEYLELVDDTLRQALVAHGAKLVFYVAGVDVLAGDLLGDFALSPRGVLSRDRRVTAACSFVGAKLVVTMAGGYGPAAWQCTSNYVRWLLTGAERVDREPDERLFAEFARTYGRIDPWDLQHDPLDLALTDDDISSLGGQKPQRLFLDYYSAHGIELALERYGLLDGLRQRGFRDLQLSMDARDPAHQVLRLEGSRETARGLLVELVVSRRAQALGGLELDVLYVEWLLMQDPTRPFSAHRPRLPGQEHPGLGMAAEVQAMLVQACHRLGLEGVAHRPAHYHNAVWAARYFHFVDPGIEGRFRAMRRVLTSQPTALASALVERGALVLRDGRPVAWEPGDYVLPVGERAKGYFASVYYTEAMKSAYETALAAGLAVSSR